MPATIETIHQKISAFERKHDFAELQQYIDAELREIASQPFPLQDYHTVLNDYPYYAQLLIEHPDLDDFVNRYLSHVLPVAQGPFPLPGRQLVQGPWLGFHKRHHFHLCDVTHDTVAGTRVLDIGCNAGFDTFYLSTLNPCEVIGIEPGPFYQQCLFFWTVYHCPSVQVFKTRWEDVTASVFGRFDLINCQGILYHERNPLALLDWLFGMLAPGGRLVLETHVTMEDDQNARFIEGAFWGSDTWWWIPSAPTVCAALRASGFSDVSIRAQNPVPSKNPQDPTRTLEGIPVGGRAYIVGRRR